MTPSLQDLPGGRLDFLPSDVASVLPKIKSGKLVALAISACSPLFPDVPVFRTEPASSYSRSARRPARVLWARSGGGTRDDLAELGLIHSVVKALGPRATLKIFEDADQPFTSGCAAAPPMTRCWTRSPT